VCGVRTKENILDMSENEVDIYLRFCERALVDHSVEEDKSARIYISNIYIIYISYILNDANIHIAVAEFFPLTAGSSRRQVSPSSLPGPPCVSGIEAARCRTSDSTTAGIIRIYRSLDTLGTLPPAFELVLERAARFCAVDAEVLASLVERFEHRLVQRAEHMRKEEGRV
jgi:hypothetical protein